MSQVVIHTGEKADQLLRSMDCTHITDLKTIPHEILSFDSGHKKNAPQKLMFDENKGMYCWYRLNARTGFNDPVMPIRVFEVVKN